MNHESSYTDLAYRLNFKRACKKAIVIILIILLILAPGLWCWNQSIIKRATLRQAKNVVMNFRLLGYEFFAEDSKVMDSSRKSGLTEYTENMIRQFSGAEGEIMISSWDPDEQCVAAMTYRNGNLLVHYEYDKENEKDNWMVYWKIWDLTKQ